ncbi:MAG TPA: Tat pathway signal sequence domain protein [Caulobacteraceae bacterium]|jgi:hypothetical protein|nr:Tat pathway signal sequence domain protein [Caulobacteraceae bacterium]
MRRILSALACSAFVSAALLPAVVHAQETKQDRQDEEKREADKQKADKEKAAKREKHAPGLLAAPHAEGPCPYVKVLYDAARDVEFKDNKEASAAVAWTGEIEAVSSDCSYKSDSPIHVAANVLFDLGRGPQAEGYAKNYRYWVAVTDRNRSVLAKQYFDLPVKFERGQDRLSTNQVIQEILIPRASATVSGNNFEVLIGFDVTPEQAQFNRDGKRFRITAGQQVASEGQTTAK